MLNINKILVPTDLHEEADSAFLIATATDLARKNAAHVTFLNVVDVDLDSAMLQRYDQIRDDYAKAAYQQLKSIIEKSVPDDVDADVMVLNGRSYSKVLEAADDLGVDLIVVAAHRPTMKDFLLGMTAARVVRHANCSVLVVRDSALRPRPGLLSSEQQSARLVGATADDRSPA